MTYRFGSLKALSGVLAGLTIALTAGLASEARAVPIGFTDNGWYTSDAASGLDWMDVSETFAWSYRQVTDGLTAGATSNNGYDLSGWRLASGTELIGLVSNWTGETLGSALNVWDQVFATGEQSLYNLIQTVGDGYGNFYETVNGTPYTATDYNYTWGYLEGQWVGLMVHYPTADYLVPVYGAPGLDGYGYDTGAFLVRATSEVPEPASLLLFASGLALLTWMRRKEKAVI
ncbi:hypothetical protein JCM17960_27660 [Magnetospira thiophila]